MQIFVPFPPFLAEISAANAAISNGRRKGKAAGDHVVNQIAAYRMPDGSVRQAYDLYAPTAAPGAEFGLADLHSKLKHYANETSGYESSCSNFQPISELRKFRPSWEEVAVSHLQCGDISGFVITEQEPEMIDILSDLPEGTQSLRSPKLDRHGLGQGQIPRVALLIATSHLSEIHIAADEGHLVEGLADRLSFLSLKGLGFSDAVAVIEDHGRNFGWQVSAGMLNPDNPVLAKIQDVDESPAP